MSSNFLEIKNATFVASEKNKIDNVSLTIKEKGEIVCLLGPSGVGKTTILRTIAGLQDLKSGEINLKGKTISSKNFNLEPEKRNIAMCFQDNSLFPHFNILENINIGAKRKNGSKFNYLCHSKYCTPCDEYQDNQKYNRIHDFASRHNQQNTAYCAIKLVNHHLKTEGCQCA